MSPSLLLAALTFSLPLPPSAEEDARALVRPYQVLSAIADPWMLTEIGLRPREVRYRIGRLDSDAALEVRLDLGATPTPTVRIVQVAPGGGAPATEAANTLAEVIRARIAAGEVKVLLPADWAADDPRGPPAPGTTEALAIREDPHDSPLYPLSRALLLVILAMIFATRRHLGAALGPVPGWAWAGVGGLAALGFAAAALLPDVVAYQNGLGLEHARFVANAAPSPFPHVNPFGAMQIEVARLLGGFAPLGREPFYASRVALCLSPLLLFLLAQALTRRPHVGVVAAGLMGLAPAWLYMGTSDFASAPGVLLLLLAGWLTVSAARSRDWRLLVLAALALLALARYRMVGPVVAVPTALLLFAVPGDREEPRWWWWTACTAALTVALALPHLLELLSLASGLAEGEPLDGAEVNLFNEPGWVPPALTVIAAAGLLVTLAMRRWLGFVLVLWVAAVLAVTTQSLNLWVNVARYQVWIVPAVALAGGCLFAAMRVALPRAAPVVLGALLVWLGHGFVVDSAVLAEHNPETRQLQLWRSSIAELPPDALLVVPTQSLGGAAASLPDAELQGARPDVELMDYGRYQANREMLSARDAYWFMPLYCHAPATDGQPRADADCVVASTRLELKPMLVEHVSGEVPEALAALGVIEARWVPVPFVGDVVDIGLYRIVGRR